MARLWLRAVPPAEGTHGAEHWSCAASVGDHPLMTTAAQLHANRANATKSSGPRTSEGRAVSALNARKHGLRAEKAALFASEAPDEWDALLASLRNDLQPEGEVEELLVERVAAATWKLRRAGVIEVGAMQAEGADDREGGLGLAAWRDANKGQTLQLVTKYARAAESSMYTALHELERRQAARRGTAVPVPVAVDVRVVSDGGEQPEPA